VRRSDLEHLIRAAGAITGSRRVVVVGSQAILGQFPYEAPEWAVMSMEADLLPIDAPSTADLLTGTIGELSAFHDSFGYYGDGVSLDTAVLPDDWEGRLIEIENENTNGYVGLCLEIHDLLISKYVAGREKDRSFCRAVADAGLADVRVLRSRLASTALDIGHRESIEASIAADFDPK
jgi:hypothetical protein